MQAESPEWMPAQLDVLHHCRYKGMGSVAYRVRLTFQSVAQETVDEDGTVRGNATAAFMYSRMLSSS